MNDIIIMNDFVQLLFLILFCSSLPLSLWFAYRLGHKVSSTEWEESIECSDDPHALRDMLENGRRRMEENPPDEDIQ